MVTAANIASLDDFIEQVKTNDDYLQQVKQNPIDSLSAAGIKVPPEFKAPVAEGLKQLHLREGRAGDARQDALEAQAKKIIEQEQMRPCAPVITRVTVHPPSSASGKPEPKLEFKATEWGLVLVLPEKTLIEIMDGLIAVEELAKLIQEALLALVQILPAALPLLGIGAAASKIVGPIVAAGMLWATITAVYIIAEIVAIIALDQIWHKGVYLTWTWVGLAITAYYPIPTPISP